MLKARELVSVDEKREAASLVAQFTDKLNYIDELKFHRIDIHLMSILQDTLAKSRVKKAAVRALLVILSAAVIYGQNAVMITVQLRETTGIKTIFGLLKEAIEGEIRDEKTQKIAWSLISLLLKLIFVMSFSKIGITRMLESENILILRKLFEKATAEKQSKVLYLTYRVYSFFS